MIRRDNFWRRVARDTDGGPAAEFALVLPLALLFLFGIIDVGRYIWEVNRAEKATQTGARWAAVTAVVPPAMATYSYALTGEVPAGTPVPQNLFSTVTCSFGGTDVTCAGDARFSGVGNTQAFKDMVDRMNDIKLDIGYPNVELVYAYSGLGYAGDPNGPDVVPIITVRLRNMKFQPITTLLFNAAVDLPDFSYALTMEDGAGNVSN